MLIYRREGYLAFVSALIDLATELFKVFTLMSNSEFSLWYKQLQKNAEDHRWRNVVVLIGENCWVSDKISAIRLVYDSLLTVESPVEHRGLYFQNNALKLTSECFFTVNSKNYNQYLGTEQEIVVFPIGTCELSDEIISDFDVDAFAALSGTIIAGGTLVLSIIKNMSAEGVKPEKNDFFLQRFLRQLKTESGYIIQQDTPLPCLVSSQADLPITIDNSSEPLLFKYGCVTQEQEFAVDAMLKVMSGHRNRPLVLTADRGRGKSSAMALAACHLLVHAQQKLYIIISAASRQALNVFFKQVAQTLPTAKINANNIEHANGEISFLPIDRILKEQPQASLVMIDEAAAFPVYLLQQLLSNYHRLIFSSTVHGYEGAGRGFSIKFRQTLNTLMPQWRKFHINEPVRWAPNDPLESFVFSSCLLNAELPKYSMENLSQGACTALNTMRVSVKQLLSDESLLQQVFSVLVTAHYQTSPSDVRLLLNNPAVSLFILKHESRIWGVVMLLKEGLVDADLAELVRDGKRRLRDQFLPQSLLTHCGVKDSFEYSYQRVMRIAIHPQCQGQGLGGKFLDDVEQQLANDEVDFIGSSFAGNANLLSFWQQSGYSLARIGFTKDKASGEHSCLLIKAVSGKAFAKQTVLAQHFYQQFDYWLTDEFKHLPEKMVWQVLHHRVEAGSSANELNAEHLQTVNDFVSGQRQFSSCVYSLHQWLVKHCQNKFDPDVLPLIARIFQKHSVEQVCADYQFTGKKLLNQHLLTYIEKYLQ